MGQMQSVTFQRCLGRGGFGEVYHAVIDNGGYPQEVAVKMLRRDLDHQGQAMRRFRDESKLLGRLDHPGILLVYDTMNIDGRVALITEYVDGCDLDTLMFDLSKRALAEVISEVASALSAAYFTETDEGECLRLVHRDVKPSNIRVARDGQVKLLDFGIARADSVTREARTRTDMMIGSPAYMAPERFLHSTSHPGSDVFALGATWFEGLSGDKLFDLPVMILASFAVAPDRYENHITPRLDQLDAPDDVVDLIRRMLAYEPDDRPTAKVVRAEVQAMVRDLEGFSLGRWARAYRWPEPPTVEGALEGRVFTSEGVLVDPNLPTAIKTLPSKKSRLWGPLGVVFGSALSATLAVMLGLFMVLLLSPFLLASKAELRRQEEESRRQAMAQPAPVEEEEPFEEEEREELPVLPEAQPEPTPKDRKVREEKAPVVERPTASPKVIEPEKVLISVDGGVAVKVGGRRLPTTLPPGEYQVEAKFDDKEYLSCGSLLVQPEKPMTIRVSDRFRNCVPISQ